MPLNIDDLPIMYSTWRHRYNERSERHDIIDKVVAGEFSVFDPDEEAVESRSPNLIQVALEDTADASSLVPTLRAQPTKSTAGARKSAALTEKAAWSLLEAANIAELIPRTVMDMAAYGLGVWTITPDPDQGIPLIERRDPRTCFLEPNHRPGTEVRRAMFAREVYYTSLPKIFQAKILAHIMEDNRELSSPQEDTKVTLIDWYDQNEYVLAAVYESAVSSNQFDANVHHLPVELERIPHKTPGVCPVVAEPRLVLDSEQRGQFDQVVEMLKTHIELASMMFDYADQAVYSDIWVRDLIGEMPYGGGAFIELGPNGAIGRVPPAVSSFSLTQDLQQLVDGMHIGARWPKSRPGEIDQAIASAKFVEATAGMMNTAIRRYHQKLQSMIERAARIGIQLDQAHFTGRKKTAMGVLRNQEFWEEYDPADLDLSARIRVEYGLGLGRDPAQNAVLHIQYGQSGYISKEFVQENLDGLTDVVRERARIDVEQFRGMALAKMLQGVESGQIPSRALKEIAEKRSSGDDLWALFEEFVVKPEEEMQAGLVNTGLGAPLPPGAPQGPGGPGGPGPGGPVPPGAPAPPSGTDILARLTSPGADGAIAGTQTT